MIKRFYISCERKRPTETLNSTGRPIKTYTSTNICGYMSNSGWRLIKTADKETTETIYKFFCDDFDLESTDLIEYNGELYELLGEPKNTANRNHHIKVMCKKIKNIKS